MQIILKNEALRRALMLLEAIVFLVLTIWISKAYLADLVGRKLERRNLELAAKLEPGNSDYQLQLGRLFEYNVPDIDPNRALEHLSRATRLNPRNAQTWLDLGAALEFQGRTGEAEACLGRVDFLAPNIPAYQWAIGNFLLLHGNVAEAFRHFKVVLAGTSQYNQALFNTAWKASGDANQILEQLIPQDVSTEFVYLYYLLNEKRYPEAASVWKRIAASSQPFPPAQAARYIDALIGARQPEQAYQVWSELRNKGLIRATYQETDQNLIINGNFEEEVMNMGFDWRIGIGGLEGVYVGLDQTNFHSPSHALFIQFGGKQNVYFNRVMQYVRVKPRHAYRLRGFVKTERITTDSGPRLQVWDAYDQSLLNQPSESLVGSTSGWQTVTLDFTTAAKTELIAVGVLRLPSRKFDNLIAGKVWVDDLTLSEPPAKTAQTRK
jgi:tetratricopeptide (TPR) repeat protein